MFAKSQHIHFVGIGGIGMSGIAEILLTLGYKVSGSDAKRSPVTDRLEQLGAHVYEGHEAANVQGAEVLVTSSAIDKQNPEVVAAREQRVPVIQRAEMLAELMRLKYGVAIAGMHGKTTTTSMAAAVLAGGGLDPTVVVGGRVNTLGSNARLGKSQYLVVEADESDRSFLKLSPIVAVVTNIDREHMDCYRDMADVENAFVEFMDRVPFYGLNIACADNDLLRGLLPRVKRRITTYGTHAESDFLISNVEMGLRSPEEPNRTFSRFQIKHRTNPLGEFRIYAPGWHNVLNATAAIAVGIALEIPADKVRSGLEDFRGVDRRFQMRGEANGVAVVDDYGHHPTEIKATLNAARQCGYKRVHVIFQPHRYTRTRDLLQDFSTAFGDADTLGILDIYAASEKPIPGVSAEALLKLIAAPKQTAYYPSFADAVGQMVSLAQPGDMVLTLGAGSVSQIGPLLLDALQARAKERSA